MSTRGVSRIPCAFGMRVAGLLRERDDFALRTCDLCQKRYTQSVRTTFRQAMNVAAREPFQRQGIPFFQILI
jgi:hypothetical protein